MSAEKRIKIVLRRMLLDCFLTAEISARTGQILGDIYIYVLEQLDLKWLQCFSVETYRSKLCCVECSLTAFWLARILPGLAKFWDIYIKKCARAFRLEVATLGPGVKHPLSEPYMNEDGFH